MTIYLDFEKPIAELEGKIAELRHLPNSGDVDIAEEVMRLQEKAHKQIRATYAKLTPWQRVQVARHAERPHAQAYIDRLITDYTPLAGDRAFGEDAAIVGGMGRLQGRSIVVLGQQKGDDTDSRIKHNFGMARPEGYRKAQRLMRLADRFKLPVLTLVDTPGAYPGIDAEARGQAEAIASSIETCLGLGVPLVSVVIGEGGSGGALAIASADRVYMLENSVYSVITPEGCASILWRNNANAQDAAEAMKVTAADLRKLEVIDDVIPEPMGGAHRAPGETIDVVGKVVAEAIADLSKLDADTLRERRQDKFLAMGKKGL
ncbi:acetyl-CoA carboxylase carboxyltransferase subunit alpha [Reyranella sp.]|jgi:acetyl-CoA carboxylase carboxyl transferase subunit alpha|uniref:acetyl-CoA carboxylase carboxyltransferase subunit alpha n=1 Tax=Reyranella sp. TaxID=1929291 RepID=UPI003BA8768F